MNESGATAESDRSVEASPALPAPRARRAEDGALGEVQAGRTVSAQALSAD